ncbi:hypothetical protein FRC02_002360 [Tulasnella sp. 418]|nr:hypothetical protein FRC02_002360 [Tulasnella sp. 418]
MAERFPTDSKFQLTWLINKLNSLPERVIGKQGDLGFNDVNRSLEKIVKQFNLQRGKCIDE